MLGSSEDMDKWLDSTEYPPDWSSPPTAPMQSHSDPTITAGVRETPVGKSPHEDVLKSREVTSSQGIGVGVTESSFIELKDDGKGVFKTIDYQNERAAYLVDRFLDFGLTPPTVIRSHEGKTGSVQEFVADAPTRSELGMREDKFVEKYKSQLMEMWIFDVIIGNTDRHSGNFLIKDDRLYAIDHGRGFNGFFRYREFGKDPWDYWGTGRDSYVSFFDEPLESDIIEKLQKFNESPGMRRMLEEALTEIVGEEAAQVCNARIDVVMKHATTSGKIP